MDMVLADQGQEFIFESRKNEALSEFRARRRLRALVHSLDERTKDRALKSGEMMQCFDAKKPFYVDYNKARALKIPSDLPGARSSR